MTKRKCLRGRLHWKTCDFWHQDFRVYGFCSFREVFLNQQLVKRVSRYSHSRIILVPYFCPGAPCINWRLRDPLTTFYRKKWRMWSLKLTCDQACEVSRREPWMSKLSCDIENQSKNVISMKCLRAGENVFHSFKQTCLSILLHSQRQLKISWNICWLQLKMTSHSPTLGSSSWEWRSILTLD